MFILFQPYNANTAQKSTPNWSQGSRQAWWVYKTEWFKYVRIQKAFGPWLFETPLSALQKNDPFCKFAEKIKCEVKAWQKKLY